MGRPKLPKVRVQLKINDAVWAALVQQAEVEGENHSEFVERVLRQHLVRHGHHLPSRPSSSSSQPPTAGA